MSSSLVDAAKTHYERIQFARECDRTFREATGAAKNATARAMEKGESSGLPAGGEDYSQATQKLVAFLTSFEEDGLDDVDYTD